MVANKSKSLINGSFCFSDKREEYGAMEINDYRALSHLKSGELRKGNEPIKHYIYLLLLNY